MPNYSVLLQMRGQDNSELFLSEGTTRLIFNPYLGAKISTAIGKYGDSSAVFDGSGAHLLVTLPIELSVIDFTLGGWFYFPSLPARDKCLFDTRMWSTDNGCVFYINGANRLSAVGARALRVAGSTEIVVNRWYHIEWTRAAGVTRVFLDGIKDGELSGYTDNLTVSMIKVARRVEDTAANAPCYVNDLYFIPDVALHTADFSPPTAALTPSQQPFSSVGECLQTGNLHAGKFCISDIVSRLGAPGPYRVCLFHRWTKKFIAQTFSDSNGVYSFNYLSSAPKNFFVIAFDGQTNPVNAAISDLITAEPMPS